MLIAPLSFAPTELTRSVAAQASLSLCGELFVGRIHRRGAKNAEIKSNQDTPVETDE